MPNHTLSGIDLQGLVKDNKKVVLRCPLEKCNTRIIPYSDKLIDITVDNAPQTIKATSESPIIEQATEFYQINDVWDFDNIGVSRPDDIKTEPVVGHDQVHVKLERYLICSECEKGPLGFAGIPIGKDSDHSNLQYFISRSSVMYDI